MICSSCDLARGAKDRRMLEVRGIRAPRARSKRCRSPGHAHTHPTPDGMASGPAAAAGNSLIENCNQINEQAGVGIMPDQAPDQREAVRVRDDGPLVTYEASQGQDGGVAAGAFVQPLPGGPPVDAAPNSATWTHPNADHAASAIHRRGANPFRVRRLVGSRAAHHRAHAGLFIDLIAVFNQ
jgi:hypothetical protein